MPFIKNTNKVKNLFHIVELNNGYQVSFPIPELEDYEDVTLGGAYDKNSLVEKVCNLEEFGKVMTKLTDNPDWIELFCLSREGNYGKKSLSLEELREYKLKEFKPFLTENTDFIVNITSVFEASEVLFNEDYYGLEIIISTKLMSEKQREIFEEIIFESKLEGDK